MRAIKKELFKTKIIKGAVSLLFCLSFGWGQSSAGDIAFTAYNADGNDDFAFVTLVAISSGAIIYFTDNEWDGDSFNNTYEGYVTWTANSYLAAGTVIVVTDANGSESVNVGTLTETGSFNLGASNETLFALSAAPATSYGSNPTFYAAISNDEDSNGNVLTNTGLTSGTHTIDFNNDHDGFEYTGSRSGQSSFSNYLAIINNTANWQDETSNGENILPISTTLFTVTTLSISGSAGFRMMSTPVSDGTYTDLLAELWTQGMTGGDVTDGSSNVWTFALGSSAAGSFSDLGNLGSTMIAGTGFLVYVFSDTDWDGDSDLPVSLSVSGSENSGNVTYPASGSIDASQYGLAGNPYYSTIDWDDVTKTNVEATVYVYDNAKSGGAGYISWNGSSGDVTNGLIAPFQGFWVQATSSGSASITIETADKASVAGPFYRLTEDDNTGSMFLEMSSGEFYYDKTFMSFRDDGELDADGADAHKLLPIMANSRLVGISYINENAFDINNLPYEYEGSVSVPFDVMLLTLDETNYVTEAGGVTLSWNLDQLPDHISMTLTDYITGSETYLDYESEYVFTTEPKGSFSATYDGPIGTYPVVGEPRFTLNVTYGALGQNEGATLPSNFALHPVYPNPFNPSATISFDIPDVSRVELNIYDVKGSLVEILLKDNMKPGKHQYNWEPQGLSSGVYFMKLTTANKSFTQKVTYIK